MVIASFGQNPLLGGYWDWVKMFFFLWKGLHVYFQQHTGNQEEYGRWNTAFVPMKILRARGKQRPQLWPLQADTEVYYYHTINLQIIVRGDFDLKRLIRQIKIYDDGLRIAEGCKEGNLCMCPSEQLRKKLMDFHQYISLCEMCVHFHIICI